MFLFSTFFYKETCYLSAVYTPTSFLGLHTMTAIAVHLDKNRNETIFQDSIQAMTAKFLKYWGVGKVPLLYGFGAILDVQAFFDLFKVYEAKLLPQYRAQPSQSQTQYLRRHQYTNVFVNAPAYSPFPQQQEAGTSQPRSSATDARSHPEIQESNRNDWVRSDDEAIDLLVWWRQNARRFPVLPSMAQDILTIPVSTVSSEAAFSSSGRIIDDRRCSLKPEMVKALTCGKD